MRWVAKPRPLDKPQAHNQSTRLCGISDTFKRNKRDPKIKIPCFSILIGPKRTADRSYTSENKGQKLEEAKEIRAASVEMWPLFTTKDAEIISKKIAWGLK